MTRFVLSTIGLLSTLSPALAQGPTVTALQPTRNAVAVPATTTVGVTFSQPISPASAGQVRVFGQQTGYRAGTASAASNQLTFTPTAAFKPGETVQVTVPTDVQSVAGVSVGPQVYQFTTGVGLFGGGTFAPPAANAEPGVGSGPQNLVLGDLDNDGDLDLVTMGMGSSGTYMVSVRLNDGLNSGNFLPPATNATLPMGTGGTRALALGDLDNDGDLDLVACETLSSVGIRRNDGGTFVRPTNFNVPVAGVPLDLALGDVDADGDLDLVTANIGNGLSVRLNDGNGSFAAPAVNPNPASGPGALRVLLGDVDSDGDLDAVVFGGNYVQLCLNTGLNSGNFVMPATGGRTLIDSSTRALAMGDVNGDGSLDLVLSRWQGQAGMGMVDVLLNDGTGAYVPWSSVAVTDKPQGLALGDVDGDGDLDLVVGNDNYNAQAVSVRLNGGVNSGTFFEPTSGAEAAIGARFPWAVALGDVNGDGQLDLLTANNNNSGSGTGGGVGTVSVRLNQVSALRAGLAPTVGNVGTQLTVRGTDLTGTTAVRFNGTLAPGFTVTSPTTLQVTVPSGASSGPVTISTPGGVLTSNTPFVLGGALAVTRPVGAALGMYPNPARTQVRVQAPAGATRVQLYDALGRLTRTVPTAAGTVPTLLPLAGLPAGMYVVRAGAATARLLVE